jgi:hypothetical protein
MRQCRLCEHENENDARFCMECGERLGPVPSAEYTVLRQVPAGYDSPDLHQHLLDSLKEMGYEIVHVEFPIRATKGARVAGDVIRDLGLFVTYLESIGSPRKRTFAALNLKHWIAITTQNTTIAFRFRVGEALIDLSLLERGDKMEFENIADHLMERTLGLVHRTAVARMPRMQVGAATRLYKDASSASSFVTTTLFLFVFPVLVEFTAGLVGWTARINLEIDGTTVEELTFPISLRFMPSLWHFQLLFLTLVTCVLILIGFVAEHRIATRLVEYGQSLETKLGKVQSGYGLRDELRRLDISPIRWTRLRILCALLGAVALVVSPFLFSTQADRIFSWVAFYIGFVVVARSCNIATYGPIKRGKIAEAVSFLWPFLAFAWLMLWYDSYIKSWVVYGIEMRNAWFLAAYGSAVVSWMVYFAYQELKDNAGNIYRVLIGRAPRDKVGSGLRSVLALCFYAAAVKTFQVPLPLLPSAIEPHMTEVVQALNDMIATSQMLFVDAFTILPSVVFVVVFVRLLWRRRLHVSIPVEKVLKAMHSEALSFGYNEGRMVLVFLTGFMLLSARAYGISANVANVPGLSYMLGAIAEFAVISLIAVMCYTTGQKLHTRAWAGAL